MPLYDLKCTVCGSEKVDVWARVEQPIRCACGGETVRLWRTRAVVGDDIPGGFVQEHFGHQPETFYSKKAMLKRADSLGLQPMVRHVQGDQHVSDWGASIDPYTLAAAIELVSRRAMRDRVTPEPPPDTFRFEVKDR